MRYAIAMIGVIWLAGCQTEQVNQVGWQPREAFTYAALAKYPGNARHSDRVNVVVLDSADRKELYLYNLSSEPTPAGSLWVNGDFVREIESIPPKGHVTSSYQNLIQAGRGLHDFSQVDQPVNKVELQVGGDLFTTQGPVPR